MRSQLACVLTVESGIFAILTSRGIERATTGGELLAAIAASDAARPGRGDWVEWRRWPDGRLTVSRLARPHRPRTHLRLVG